MSGFARSIATIAATLILGACATPRYMMPTPNVHLQEGYDAYADLGATLKSTQVRLFYATDRAPEQDEDGNLRYGWRRSQSIGFGTTVVDLGTELDWDGLLEASRTDRRLERVQLEVREVTELVRGPPTPLPYKVIDGKFIEEETLARKRAEDIEAFEAQMLRALALTPRKEVFLYVHGYRNTFDDAAFAMAELWHFLGRTGVPIVYTWPAGHPGLFGYTYDRESSEFTVYHLRRVIRVLAAIDEIEKIHVIAHSRGTDVAVTALRELTIASRAAGRDPRREFRIHDLVLAAPDLDVQVAVQRIIGDKLAQSVHRMTVYTSPADRAIGIASKLYASPLGRIGTFGVEVASENIKEALKYGNANFAFIRFAGTDDAAADRYGHSYFRDAPTVSSDLVLMLRDNLDPGDPGRPLESVGPKFWQIPEGYPTFSGRN